VSRGRSFGKCYAQFFLVQVKQTAACNATHNVRARTFKWLLRMHILVGAEQPLVHTFLAQMTGVPRTSVTENAVDLQKAGLIAYSRGRTLNVAASTTPPASATTPSTRTMSASSKKNYQSSEVLSGSEPTRVAFRLLFAQATRELVRDGQRRDHSAPQTRCRRTRQSAQAAHRTVEKRSPATGHWPALA
jgi:hypothetical protein